MESQPNPAVILRSRDYRIARDWAEERAENRDISSTERANNSQEPPPVYFGPMRSFKQRSLPGVLGELAFSEYTGAEISSDNTGPDGGIDFTVDWQGEKTIVDVKTIENRHYSLQVNKKGFTADIYVLAIVNYPKVLGFDEELCEVTLELAGYATAEEVKSHKVVEARQSKDMVHRVPQHELHAMPSSEDICEYRNLPPWEQQDSF